LGFSHLLLEINQNTNTIETLTEKGREKIRQLAEQHRISTEAVTAMLAALINGNGQMAQFDIPELGGYGQWMKGGMTMVGDMFNNKLKAQVEALCQDLADLMNNTTIFRPTVNTKNMLSDNWWPAGLGHPNSSGAQNGLRYAYFADTARLAVDHGGDITVYDTLDHRITGVSQQQGSGQDLQFTSQYGRIDLRKLPVVAGKGEASGPDTEKKQSAAMGDIFQIIEKLAGLREKGIISQEEFDKKKQELLDRL
jgi:hypothetical protein